MTINVFCGSQMSIYKYFTLLFHTVLVLKEALAENYKTTGQLFPKHDTATESETNWNNKERTKFPYED